MVIGVGTDIIDIDRMAQALARHGQRFVQHVFCHEEQAAAPEGVGAAAYYAGRWAAKEAVAKALGTGIGTACAWRDVYIARSQTGAPVVELSGRAAQTATARGIANLHVSISHERRVACAVAIAESLPSII